MEKTMRDSPEYNSMMVVELGVEDDHFESASSITTVLISTERKY